jgi:DNA-binding transcriptional MerR regulator
VRISELSDHSGVPVASIKFYIREGMLPRGTAISATRAEYGEEHLARLRLIQALSDVRALPLARVKEILALVDEPAEAPYTTLGRAVSALPPYVDEASTERARETIESLGLTYDPRFAAVGQLEAAIRGIESAGLVWDAEIAMRYAGPMAQIAEAELAPLADLSANEQVPYAVLGTALYEPAILALRRLAHQHLLASRGDATDDGV